MNNQIKYVDVHLTNGIVYTVEARDTTHFLSLLQEIDNTYNTVIKEVVIRYEE